MRCARTRRPPWRGRLYAYDANGNMTEIDGLACTWDFKDRLIAVENAQMRADYTYDYTDRRITKCVTPRNAELHSARENPEPAGTGAKCNFAVRVKRS